MTRTFKRLDPERQQEILMAILDEAAEKGPSSLNINKVAERAGVSVGSLYTYFENRKNMLDFAVKLCTRYLSDEMDKYRPYLSNLSLRDGLVAYLTGGIEWSRTEAGFVRLFARAAYQGDEELAETLVKPVSTAFRQVVYDILNQAVMRGEIRNDVDLDIIARVIHTIMIAIGDSQLLPYLNNYYQLPSQDSEFQRVVDKVMELILHGIGSK